MQVGLFEEGFFKKEANFCFCVFILQGHANRFWKKKIFCRTSCSWIRHLRKLFGSFFFSDVPNMLNEQNMQVLIQCLFKA